MTRQSSKSKRQSSQEGLRYRRIVVKVGTNVLTAGTDRLDLEVMAALVGQVARLHKEGAAVLVVTSGAIAAGRHRLGVSRDRKGMPFRQMLAAVGQSDLMQAYQELFRPIAHSAPADSSIRTCSIRYSSNPSAVRAA